MTPEQEEKIIEEMDIWAENHHGCECICSGLHMIKLMKPLIEALEEIAHKRDIECSRLCRRCYARSALEKFYGEEK